MRNRVFVWRDTSCSGRGSTSLGANGAKADPSRVMRQPRSPTDFDSAHKAFHEAVLDYCLEIVSTSGEDQNRRRLAFWGTLALMRCVGSSPAAAASALRNRLSGDLEKLGEQVFDDDEAESIDVEPASGLERTALLEKLIAQADRLVKAKIRS